MSIAPDFDVGNRLKLLKNWLPNGATVYEIGDKMGEFHTALLSAGYRVTGDDVMTEGNERREWLDGLFRRGGQFATPPPSLMDAFDAVLAYFVVEHLANPNEWLRSVRRLLKPEGILVIEVPQFLNHPEEALMHEHFLYLTPESLSALCGAAGYDVLEQDYFCASRAFGFCVVAQRSEMQTLPILENLIRLTKIAREAYSRGHQLQASAQENLLQSAHLIAAAIKSEPLAPRISFFGANQTAAEIQAHLSKCLILPGIEPKVYDNSDAKVGVFVEGFSHPVEKPVAEAFDPMHFHIAIICSRGWTSSIAQQIRDFNLPRLVLIDGGAAQLLAV